MSARNPPDPVVEIAASRPGPQVGAFFDLDGTLVAGFTATAHAGDRIRRRQARIGEVLGVVEASMRYRFGRMQFERLIVRAAGYLRGEAITDLDELGERLFVDRVASRVYPLMRGIVRAHQERGHTVVLCSSALDHPRRARRPLPRNSRCSVQPFRTRSAGGADRRGHEAHRVGTAEGRRGTTNSAPTMASKCPSSYFYADDDEDAVLMSLVGHPRPVNPRSGLAAMAAERGWPVLQVAGESRRTLRRIPRP